MNTIASELLCEIINTAAIATDPWYTNVNRRYHDVQHPPYQLKGCGVSLSLVCRRWYGCVHGDARNWKIVVDKATWKAKPNTEDRIVETIQTYPNAVIDITISTYQCGFELINPASRLGISLLANRKRWRKLVLSRQNILTLIEPSSPLSDIHTVFPKLAELRTESWPFEDHSAFTSIFGASLPSLNVLDVETPSSLPAFARLLSSIYLPSLSVLRLRDRNSENSNGDSAVFYKSESVKDLRLGDSTSGLGPLHLANNCFPNLTRLRLASSSFGIALLPDVVTLAALRTLSVFTGHNHANEVPDSIFFHLDLPNIENFEVTHTPPLNDLTRSQILPIASPWLARLKYFRFDTWHRTYFSDSDILWSLAAVEHINLQAGPRKAECFLDAMLNACNRKPPPDLPQLSTLTIGTGTMPAEFFEKILQVLNLPRVNPIRKMVFHSKLTKARQGQLRQLGVKEIVMKFRK